MYKVRGAYVGRSGRSVLCIERVEPVWGVAVDLSMYRGRGAYVGRSGRSVLSIGRVVPMWEVEAHLSYV